MSLDADYESAIWQWERKSRVCYSKKLVPDKIHKRVRSVMGLKDDGYFCIYNYTIYFDQ